MSTPIKTLSFARFLQMARESTALNWLTELA